MSKYWALVKIHFQLRLAYRADMLIYSFSSALFPIIGLALWLTTAQFNNLPYSHYELIIYFMLAIYIGIATEMWQSWFISEEINDGSFSKYLLKPLSILQECISELISDKTYKMSMVTLLAPVVYLMIPRQIWAEVSVTLSSMLLFILALIIGFIIVFLIELTVGLSTIWFYDISFIKSYLDLANTLFSGKFIPLLFFPAFLSQINSFLPFQYSVSFPIEVLLNKLSMTQLIYGFSMEIVWLLITIVLYKIVYSKFKKNYQGYGA